MKTEASKRPIPIDPFVAEDPLAWYRTAKYTRAVDYIFATDAPRAGKKPGKQPVWLSKVMTYQIQPAAKRVGITKHIGWHTFRHTYTTLLHANGEDIKTIQELLRHSNYKVTADHVHRSRHSHEERSANKACEDDSPAEQAGGGKTSVRRVMFSYRTLSNPR